MHTSIQSLTRMSLFTALGVALGYALLSIPNVELVTATVFVAGAVLGAWKGLLVGAMTEGLYSSFHPLGTPAPPLLAAQILSMGLTGVMGGWFGTRRVRLSPLRIAQLGAAGFMATLVFAVLTTAAYALTVSLSGSSIVTSLLVGLGFYVVHLASNTLIFCTVVPSVLKALAAVTPSMGGKT